MQSIAIWDWMNNKGPPLFCSVLFTALMSQEIKPMLYHIF